jgi:hypothetical protein
VQSCRSRVEIDYRALALRAFAIGVPRQTLSPAAWQESSVSLCRTLGTPADGPTARGSLSARQTLSMVRIMRPFGRHIGEAGCRAGAARIPHRRLPSGDTEWTRLNALGGVERSDAAFAGVHHRSRVLSSAKRFRDVSRTGALSDMPREPVALGAHGPRRSERYDADKVPGVPGYGSQIRCDGSRRRTRRDPSLAPGARPTRPVAARPMAPIEALAFRKSRRVVFMSDLPVGDFSRVRGGRARACRPGTRA